MFGKKYKQASLKKYLIIKTSKIIIKKKDNNIEKILLNLRPRLINN